MDITILIFEWTNENGTNSFNPAFEGNITNIYRQGLMVRISLTIKYVKFAYQTVNFEMGIFEEQWKSIDYFKSDLDSGGEGFKPFLQSIIELV